MYTRLLKVPSTTFFLLGPRGTGKTTWLNVSFPKSHRIDLLNEDRFQTYLAEPEIFYLECLALPKKSWVIVDEIQRLPVLLNAVHRLIEERQIKFALTGSSARKLRRGGANLLGGRALQKTMYPLTALELGEDFKLEHALEFGTLPIILSSDDPKDQLKAYSQLYLKEEIQAEALVRNLAGFSRFLPIASLFHGQTINISNIARDAQVARTTIDGYLQILEDTLLLQRLPAFEGRLRVREKKHPKIYFFDPGLVRGLRKDRGQPTEMEKGPLFEGLVWMHLRLAQDYWDLFDEMFYWSPAEAQKTEVDFLLKRGKEFFAFEVKATSRLRPEHFRGLNALGDNLPLKRKILIYMGSQTLRTTDGIEVMPFAKWISELEKM